MTKERPTHLCSLEIDPRDPSAIIQAQADRIAELEALSKRCRRELLEVLHSANKGKVHFDGDDFHELLRDLDQHLKP